MSSNTYNGWTNRATWAVSLHLNNNPQLYSVLKEIVDNKDLSGIEKDDALQEFCDGLVDSTALTPEDPDNVADVFVQDMFHIALSQVNWTEVVENNKEV